MLCAAMKCRYKHAPIKVCSAITDLYMYKVDQVPSKYLGNEINPDSRWRGEVCLTTHFFFPYSLSIN